MEKQFDLFHRPGEIATRPAPNSPRNPVPGVRELAALSSNVRRDRELAHHKEKLSSLWRELFRDFDRNFLRTKLKAG